MINVTVLLISHDFVFFDGVGSPFEALPRFGISRDQNAYKCERGCLTFHSILKVNIIQPQLCSPICNYMLDQC
jgi:hypothetical protein